MARSVRTENFDLPATKKQTYTIFRLGAGDVRDQNLTRKAASDMIKDLLAKKGGATGNSKAPAQSKADEFAELYQRAVAAGKEAVAAFTPTPMVVSQHANPFDDRSPIDESWFVEGGACGFAWCNISPGNSPFANWLKKQGLARKSYHGGVDIWISDYGQSIQRKETHAYAMVNVFAEAGIAAYANSRMD